MELDWERHSSLYSVLISNQQQLLRDAFCSTSPYNGGYDVFPLSSMGKDGLDEIKSMLK